MRLFRWESWRLLCGLAVLSGAAAAEPWALHRVEVDQPVPVETAIDGLMVEQATLRATADGPAVELAVQAAGLSGTVGLMAAAFDAQRRPLAAGYEQVALPRLIGRRSRLASHFSLTIGFGPLPDGEPVAFVAIGPLRRPVNVGNLLSLAAGARVVDQSSSYGGSYSPERAIDDNPASQWATETGKISDQWLVVELAGGQARKIAGVGINPWGEPGYPNCALKRFTLQVSTTGTQPEDFSTVLSHACAFENTLQKFPVAAVEARYLKLICHDNHGNDQWIELTSFEAYPERELTPPPTDLALLLRGFAEPGVPAQQARLTDGPIYLNFALLDLDATRELFLQPQVAQPSTPTLEQIGCKTASAEWVQEATEDRDLRCLRVTYGFGMLLGGARQLCAAVVAEQAIGQPARMQFDALVDPPTNRLRVAVWDSRDAWFEYGVEGSGAAWQRHWVDLDPATISKRSGPDAPVWPLTKLAVGVAPKGREGLDGNLSLADPILLYAAP